ncbi:hypothetical protein K1719_046207 [Acacia pycnantha]|nr:hypothetical protein K1719_046207 [Acacia pycnantha]
MDNFLYWNIRGANNKKLHCNLKVVCAGHNPSLIALAETKCPCDSPLRPLLSNGFDSLFCVPSEGRSGGLALMWKSSCISVKILESSRQFIHFICDLRELAPFLVTMVYAVPHSNLRQILWADLKQISAASSLPWIVCGDFNDILLSSERYGGANCLPNRLRWFADRDKTLKDFAFTPLSDDDLNSYIAEWVMDNSWDFPRIASYLPNIIVRKLVLCHASSSDNGDDLIGWNGTNSGAFSLRSAYDLVEGINPRVLEKLLEFLFPVMFSLRWFLLNFKKNLGNVSMGIGSKFGRGSRKLWLWRNKSCFDNDFSKPTNPALIIVHCWQSFCLLQEDRSMGDSFLFSPSRWLPPELHWTKLNVDGAVAQSTNAAQAVGVLRDHQGTGLLVSHLLWAFVLPSNRKLGPS